MVQFGTSGWRGIIGEDVTFRRVRIATKAILDVLAAAGAGREGVLIGYDTRMLSAKFGETAGALATGHGVKVGLADRDVPAPAFAGAVRDHKASAGLLFTGSHNPPEWNGLKLYTSEGILAPTELTDLVEARFREIEDDYDDVFLSQPDLMTRFDPKVRYLERLQTLIDWDAIRSAGVRVAVDPLFGSAREYLDHILLENQVETTVIHNTRDPYFGGYAPNCTSEVLSRLRDVMRRERSDIGLSTDGDGDRFGILDVGARLKEPSLSLALIFDYLVRRRGLSGCVGRTMSTSHIIDAIARSHGLKVIETPVGFKNFGPMLVDGTLEFAGEESAGLAWTKHLPERDGILACLLAVEMVAVEGRSLVELGRRLLERVGPLIYRRTQLPTSARLEARLDQLMERELTDVDGRPVVSVDRRDGLKVRLEDGGWFMIRRAGTEPMIRLHAEGGSREEVRFLMHQARRLLGTRRS